MVNISEELKDIYKNDLLPYTERIAHKELVLSFPSINLTISNKQLISESMELTESICSSNNLEFGSCEASEFKITVADVEQELKEQIMVVHQVIEEEHTMPIGVYVVYSEECQDNLRFKDIVAYDVLKSTDIDVASWYNALDFSELTLSNFRRALLTHLGLEEDTSNLPLPNDNMIIKKTIEPSQISARKVLKHIEEINGCFGHIDRTGQFTHIILPELEGDYPMEDYPEEDYPMEENNEMLYQGIMNVRFKEYTCQGINKLQIRQEENDIGCIVGTGSNTYIIQGNFLVYGKDHQELTLIANNIAVNIFGREYRPYTAEALGMPFIEVGDLIKLINDESVRGYVLNRTLTGIQSLRDRFIADGSKELEQNFTVNEEIIQLQGKAMKIEKSVAGLGIIVEDTKQELMTEIEVIAGQVVLKVDTSGNLGYVALTANPDDGMTNVKIKANSIELEGLITLNGNVKVLEDGTLEAVNAKFSGQISGSEIYGSIIETYGNDGRIRSTSWDGNENGVYGYDITIQNGSMTATRTFYHSSGYTSTTGSSLTHDTLTTKHIIADSIDSDIIGSHDSMFYFLNMHGVNGAVQINSDTSNPYIYVGGQSGSVALRNGDVACNTINGYTPITSANKNNYYYPPSSHDHSDYVMVLNDLALRVQALESA